MPAARRPGEHADQVGQINGYLRDENIVSADGHACEAGDPAGVPTHRLDDHDAAVALGGRAKSIDGFGDHVDGGVEAEGEIGEGQIIVDGFGNADNGQLKVVVEADGDSQGVVAANHDQRIQSESPEVLA